MITKKYACPCCGYLTLHSSPPGTYEICPVCFWEDDQIQSVNATYEGGANGISLQAARQNFQKFGACEACSIRSVRPPLPEEIPPTDNDNLH